MQAAFAGALDFHHEIDAGTAMELIHHDAFGAVDDELAAAEHDGNVAQVDLFLDRLLLGELEPDLERPAVSQAELAALVGFVAGLAQFIAEKLQAERLVVALHGKNLAQHALDPLVLALLPGNVLLQESVVAAGLDLRQVRNPMRGSLAAEATDFLGLNTSLGGSRHGQSPLRKARESPQAGGKEPTGAA